MTTNKICVCEICGCKFIEYERDGETWDDYCMLCADDIDIQMEMDRDMGASG